MFSHFDSPSLLLNVNIDDSSFNRFLQPSGRELECPSPVNTWGPIKSSLFSNVAFIPCQKHHNYKRRTCKYDFYKDVSAFYNLKKRIPDLSSHNGATVVLQEIQQSYIFSIYIFLSAIYRPILSFEVVNRWYVYFIFWGHQPMLSQLSLSLLMEFIVEKLNYPWFRTETSTNQNHNQLQKSTSVHAHSHEALWFRYLTLKLIKYLGGSGNKHNILLFTFRLNQKINLSWNTSWDCS